MKIYLVHLDAGNDVLLYQAIHHQLSVSRGLVQRLLEKDRSGDVLSQSRRGAQQLPVRLPIHFVVLQPDRR